MVDKTPSLRELERIDLDRRMEKHRASLESRAHRYGIKFKPGIDIWDLSDLVYKREDRDKRPRIEARARSLGVSTSWFFGLFQRSNVDIQLACYRVEDRLRLARKLGYTK